MVARAIWILALGALLVGCSSATLNGACLTGDDFSMADAGAPAGTEGGPCDAGLCDRA